MNFAYSIYSLYRILLWTNNIEFLDQIYPRKILKFKNRKSEHLRWILHIKISLRTKFQLKLTILIFSPDLPKMRFSGLKQKKWTLIFHIILHIQISLSRNISSNWQFWFFGPNLPKKVFLVKTRNSEHHYWIPHILINLVTKFQFKFTILISLTRFTQKAFFWSKTEKVNTTYFLHNSAYSN